MHTDTKSAKISKGQHGGPRRNSGGKRPGAGRPKGSVNKVGREIRELAQQHGEMALNRLVHLATKAESEAVQANACRDILDRAYGKAAQLNINENEHNLSDPMIELFARLKNATVYPGSDDTN